MILRPMVYSFYLALKAGLKIAGLKDKGFKEQLKQKNFVMVIKTRNPDKGQSFTIQNGCILLGKANPARPDVVVEWQDQITALRTLLKLSPKALAESMADAVTSGKLKIECQIEPLTWFGLIMKDMISVLTGKK